MRRGFASKKEKKIKEISDPLGYVGERFRQMDPEAESWPELWGYFRGGKEVSSLLLGLATGPTNQIEKRQINKRKDLQTLIDDKMVISTWTKPSWIWNEDPKKWLNSMAYMRF